MLNKALKNFTAVQQIPNCSLAGSGVARGQSFHERCVAAFEQDLPRRRSLSPADQIWQQHVAVSVQYFSENF
jgi:hypothetical protein